MSVKRRNYSPSSRQIETLESRTFLSGSPAIAPIEIATPVEQSAVVRDVNAAKQVTHTTLNVKAADLGQGSVFLVTVKTAAKFGTPEGTVNLTYHGVAVTTLTLSPATSKNKNTAESTASYTIAPGGGAQPYYFGSHRFEAAFTSSGSMLPSEGSGALVVKTPKFKNESGNLKVATVIPGAGTATLQAMDTANMAFTGYLYEGGAFFDDSDAHGGFSYEEMAPTPQVIAGFDSGALGMKVGETRVLIIPSSLAYGATGFGTSVPPNAKLVFIITLMGIS